MPVWVGTSGWCYPHWKHRFYPVNLHDSEWLAYYARHFQSVEVNNSFYRLPSVERVTAWRTQVPEGFRFSIKASRYLTHMRKLTAPAAPLQRLCGLMAALGDKRGPMLFQLPPRWVVDIPRLQAFLDLLPDDIQAAFEFRDPDWHIPAVISLLAARNAAFCIYDLNGFESPRQVSADFLYLRLHGPRQAYRGCYDPGTLAAWAKWISRQPVRDAYVYFDNDESAYAVENAISLQGMLA